jgi:hypothetical protein
MKIVTQHVVIKGFERKDAESSTTTPASLALSLRAPGTR